ncbi:MAG: hypothetical protein M9894_30220 [Planctomycetes bacterium]|nr:hypothetical protein [Planctomycetota bacterium]
MRERAPALDRATAVDLAPAAVDSQPAPTAASRGPAAAREARPAAPARPTRPPAPTGPSAQELHAALEASADPAERRRLVAALRALRHRASPLALANQEPVDLEALADARAAHRLPEQHALLMDLTRAADVRDAASRALASVTTARPLLLDAAARGDAAARALAARALAAHAGADRDAALARLRDDPVAAVREAARRALGEDAAAAAPTDEPSGS